MRVEDPARVFAVRRRLRQRGPVPLYEYACRRCAHEFEALVRSGEAPECPACHGTALDKLMSAAAVGRASAREAAAPMGGCGTCGDPRGPGACAAR